MIALAGALNGAAAGVGAVDLLAGWEQRIDAGQFTRDTPRWFRLGVRLTAQAW